MLCTFAFMEKYYLINKKDWFKDYDKLEPGVSIIRFEMPPFTSGEYLAMIFTDNDGLYIDAKNKGYFGGCRDIQIVDKSWKNYEDFKKLV